MASVARYAIVPLQDVLALGSEARMNTPSQISGNWEWRFLPGALRSQTAEALATLTEISDRDMRASLRGQQSYREVREDFSA